MPRWSPRNGREPGEDLLCVLVDMASVTIGIIECRWEGLSASIVDEIAPGGKHTLAAGNERPIRAEPRGRSGADSRGWFWSDASDPCDASHASPSPPVTDAAVSTAHPGARRTDDRYSSPEWGKNLCSVAQVIRSPDRRPVRLA